MKLIKIVLCLLVVIIACANPTETEEDPRIVWGQSIAGIKLGDDSLIAGKLILMVLYLFMAKVQNITIWRY